MTCKPPSLAALALGCALASAMSPAAAQVRFVPPPKAYPFSTAVEVDGILYVSGEIGVDASGKLVEGFEAQARQTMDNIAATLKTEGLTFGDVFKCTVYLADMSRFGDFNKIYVPYFNPQRLPARSAVGANALAGGALMEVECWAKAK